MYFSVTLNPYLSRARAADGRVGLVKFALPILYVLLVACSDENASQDARLDAAPIANGDASAPDAPVMDAAAAEVASDTASMDAASVDGGAPFAGNCDKASLLVNCGFELPAAGTGGFVLRTPGKDVGGWLVIGAAGNVGALSSAYADRGFSWPAQQGAQTLDLTGNTNTATGVSQAVVTLTGEEYELSFWLGNIVDSGGHYGVESTVSVLVNGSEILRPTNAEGAGTSTVAWRQFVTTFKAQGASTTIAFVNADVSADHSNIIDNVVLLQR